MQQPRLRVFFGSLNQQQEQQKLKSNKSKTLQTQISAEVCTHQRRPRHRAAKARYKGPFSVQARSQCQSESIPDDPRRLCKMILRFNLLLSLCTSFQARSTPTCLMCQSLTRAAPAASPPRSLLLERGFYCSCKLIVERPLNGLLMSSSTSGGS